MIHLITENDLVLLPCRVISEKDNYTISSEKAYFIYCDETKLNSYVFLSSSS
jgi:hypothetical protein